MNDTPSQVPEPVFAARQDGHASRRPDRPVAVGRQRRPAFPSASPAARADPPAPVSAKYGTRVREGRS